VQVTLSHEDLHDLRELTAEVADELLLASNPADNSWQFGLWLFEQARMIRHLLGKIDDAQPQFNLEAANDQASRRRTCSDGGRHLWVMRSE
jgi:hypothetical protein